MLKLYSNQLAAQLQKSLAPVYLVFGEEPLQKQESIDLIRAAAKKQGFDERQSYSWDNSFSWNDFLMELNNLSLFSPRRIFELELPAKTESDYPFCLLQCIGKGQYFRLPI